MSKDGSPVLFREVQTFSFPWPGILLVLVGFVSVGLTGSLMIHGMWVQLVVGQPWGHKPMPDGILLFFGPAAILLSFLPLLLLRARITVEVRTEGVSVDAGFLARKRVIPRAEIVSCAVAPMSGLEFGIRRGPAPGRLRGLKRVTYRLEGSEGVELRLQDGGTVVIASHRARALHAAIEATRGPESSVPPSSTKSPRRL